MQHICVRRTIQAEGAIIVKKKNGCHLRNVAHIDIIFRILGAYVHKFVQVLWSSLWPGGLSTYNDYANDDNGHWHMTVNSWLCKLFGIMPKEPIIYFKNRSLWIFSRCALNECPFIQKTLLSQHTEKDILLISQNAFLFWFTICLCK